MPLATRTQQTPIVEYRGTHKSTHATQGPLCGTVSPEGPYRGTSDGHSRLAAQQSPVSASICSVNVCCADGRAVLRWLVRFAEPSSDVLVLIEERCDA